MKVTIFNPAPVACRRPLSFGLPDGSQAHLSLHLGKGRNAVEILDYNAGPAFKWHPSVVRAALGFFVRVDGVEMGDFKILLRNEETFIIRGSGATRDRKGQIIIQLFSGLDVGRYWASGSDGVEFPDGIVKTFHHWNPKWSLVALPQSEQEWTEEGVIGFPDENNILSLTAVVELNYPPATAVAEGWQGNYGPFGIVPDPIETDAGWHSHRATQEFHRLMEAEPLEDPPRGLHRAPGDTGSQDDFGVTICHHEANGAPEAIHALLGSVYRESLRPTHLRDKRGRLVTLSDKEDVHCWDGRPFRTGNMLGTEEISTEDTHGWWGRDRSHWSAQLPCELGLLTANPWLIYSEIPHLVDLWLAQTRMDTGNPTIDGIGEPRGIGRTMQAGAWLYCVTKDERIKQRLIDRVKLVANSPNTYLDVTIATLGVRAGEEKSDLHKVVEGGEKIDFTMPWQDSLAVLGVRAAQLVADPDGDVAEFEAIIKSIGYSVIVYGAIPAKGSAELQPPGSGPNRFVKSREWREGRGEGVRVYYDGYGKWFLSAALIDEGAPHLVDQLKGSMSKEDWARWSPVK